MNSKILMIFWNTVSAKLREKRLVNDTQECSWEELRVKIATFIEAYKSIADITKNIPLVLHGHKEIDFAVAIYACLLNKIPFYSGG